ncbi:unnamed protein product [Adineta steineri]|uniref:Uncharacterized protein n=1 Tax=Adineta steineri TaxID=433720 RepID=A0A819TIV7_9BILA|nr:unnamed protein product [Adineta steineri]CAF4077974.1 unnamed protein product [Adineta steineri]
MAEAQSSVNTKLELSVDLNCQKQVDQLQKALDNHKEIDNINVDSNFKTISFEFMITTIKHSKTNQTNNSC